MNERKVLNKYYPPNFDPAKISRRRQPKNQQMKVRMMLPMSIQCKTCGNYIGAGTKFNSRKEDVVGEKYLGIQIFRVYFKCTKCSSEITYKTNPKNSNYIVESGAKRNLDRRADDEEAKDENRKRKAEELGDPMKSLENRTFDSKREMDRDAPLAEMVCLKKEQATISMDILLEALQRKRTELGEEERKQQEKYEAESRLYFRAPKEKEMITRRMDDDDDDDFEDWFPSSPTKKQKLDHGSSGKNPTDVLINAAKPLERKTGEGEASTSSKGRRLTLFSSLAVIISEKRKKPTSASDDGLKEEDAKGKGKEVDVAYGKSCLQLIEAYSDSEDDD